MRNLYEAAMRERIDAGVAWLNSRTEEWWNEYSEDTGYEVLDGRWLDLDLDQLDLTDGQYCVLGQAGGSYSSVKDFAGLTYGDASSLGFILSENEYGRKSNFKPQHYSMLTELWIAKIKQLRQDKLSNSAAN